MNNTSFDTDLLECVVDLVVCCCHSVQPFFCGGGREFPVIVKVNSARLPAIYDLITLYRRRLGSSQRVL